MLPDKLLIYALLFVDLSNNITCICVSCQWLRLASDGLI